MQVQYRAARLKEHDAIVKIARKSPYTKDFSNQMMFSSEASYSRGWITVAVGEREIVGFACFREKSRTPEVVLYFVGVLEYYRRRGIAWGMISQFMSSAKHDVLTLKVDKNNVEAQGLYRKTGFVSYGDDPKYLLMRRRFVRKTTVSCRNRETVSR